MRLGERVCSLYQTQGMTILLPKNQQWLFFVKPNHNVRAVVWYLNMYAFMHIVQAVHGSHVDFHKFNDLLKANMTPCTPTHRRQKCQPSARHSPGRKSLKSPAYRGRGKAAHKILKFYDSSQMVQQRIFTPNTHSVNTLDVRERGS